MIQSKTYAHQDDHGAWRVGNTRVSLDSVVIAFDQGYSPETIQQQVREGRLGAQLAMKYLVPMARVNLEDCARMAAAFVQHGCDTRQAGQLYAAWREGSRMVRERILAEPELFLKTQRRPPATRPAAAGLERDLEMGGCHPASRRPTARRSPAGDGWPRSGTSATPDGKRASGTGADGGANRKGTGSPTC